MAGGWWACSLVIFGYEMGWNGGYEGRRLKRMRALFEGLLKCIVLEGLLGLETTICM